MTKQDDIRIRNRFRKCMKAGKRILEKEATSFTTDNLVAVATLLYKEGYGQKEDMRYKEG